jgi:hypothetical protein
MPQLRFLGTEPAYVTPLDRTVEPDEAVDVDDALVWSEDNETGFVWPEETWAVVGSRKRKSERDSADDTTKES